MKGLIADIVRDHADQERHDGRESSPNKSIELEGGDWIFGALVTTKGYKYAGMKKIRWGGISK